MPRSRGTIAVLSDECADYQSMVVDAVAAVLGAAGFGTLCVTGRHLVADADADRDTAVCNGIYTLVRRTRVRGLICLSGTLGHLVGPDTVADFLDRYPMPIVSVGSEVRGVCSIVVDDAIGMTELMEHLVGDERRRRFAFVRGLPDDVYSLERERIFRHVLARHGRDADEALFVSGNYDAFDAYDAVARLLARRPDVDAIVAANDVMALSAARAVAVTGRLIPDDVVVTGFDDSPDATRHSPALTTVRQPLLKVAELGATRLLEMIGEAAPGSGSGRGRGGSGGVRLNSELVVRGSTTSCQSLVRDGAAIDGAALEELLRASMIGLRAPDGVDLTGFSEALADTITRGSPRLAGYVSSIGPIGQDGAHWWSNLCHQVELHGALMLRASGHEERLAQIEAALARVRERIWACEMEREFRARRLERMRATMQLEIGSCTGIDEIVATIGRWIEAFRARRFFLVCYDEPSVEPRQSGTLIGALRGGVFDGVASEPFATRELLPACCADELGHGSLLLNPVIAGSHQFGYLLIDPEGLDVSRIDSAAHSIGNALRSHHLIDALESQATRLRDTNTELSTLANHDALTGLPNRLCMERRLHELCGRGRAGGRFALCFLDLDGFKLVNDTLGHEVGDLLLVKVAERLERIVHEIVGEGSFVARLGGDEFTVVLLSSALDEDIERVVPELLASIAEPYVLAGHSITVTASIGGAISPDHGTDATTLLKRADTAMYGAKGCGKNGFLLYRPDLMADIESRSVLAQAMREAFGNGEFRMHFQPRVELASGRICAAEALMRWIVDGPDGEVPKVGPDVFIPVAEESGFIAQLEGLALEEACRQASFWEREGTPLRVSVNISAVQLKRGNFVRLVVEAMARHDLSPQMLELEITETAAMEDIEDSIEKLGRLRALGVGVSIDDFGTGHSSLSYLGRLPADTLKIDRSFVRAIDLSGDPSCGGRGEDLLILRAIIALAKSLGFSLVAEGVETEAQRHLLESLGCDEGQGYLFARPGAADDIALPRPWLTERRACG